MKRIQRVRAWCTASLPAAVTGAFFLLGTSTVLAGEFGPVHALLLLAVGGIYGMAIRAVMGFFPVDRWGLVVAGLLSGPIPGGLILSLRRRTWSGRGDRGGGWLFALLLGVLVGVVEGGVGGRRAPGLPR